MDEERRSHLALGRLAGEQHGVVSAWQLAGLGYSKDDVGHAVVAGRLYPSTTRLTRWATEPSDGTENVSQRCSAAETQHSLSHRSAAWLWGLTSRFALPVEVTAASRRQSRKVIRIHSAAALTSSESRLT